MKNGAAIEWFAWRLFVLAGCAIIVVRLTSVRTTPPATMETAFAQLVTEPEIAGYKQRVLDAAAMRSTRCTRPVLRGTPLPGPRPALPSDAAITGCIEAWKNVLSHEQRTPEKLPVIERCASTFETTVRAAVSHADACSPYGLGGPEEPEGWVLFMGQALGERARIMADAGDVQGALWLLLDLVRLGQDQARGRTDVLATMIGSALIAGALDHAFAILAAAAPANVDELAAAVDALLASEPSFGEPAATDGFRVALDVLAALEPASWVPPGGKRSHQPSPATDQESRGQAIEVLVFASTSPAKVARACPADASLVACRRGFSGPAESMPSDGTLRATLLQALVENQTAPYLTSWPAYVDKRAIAHGMLIGLRLRLAVLKHGCDRAALAKLASTPYLGDAMRLEYADGGLVVSPPAWVETEEPPQRIRCTR